MKRRDIQRGMLYEIKDQLDAAPHGSAEKILETYAEQFGVSVSTLRRWLRKQFRPDPRREGSGRPRSITPMLLDTVWDFKVSGEEMGLARREVSTQVVLDELAAMGLDGADEASASGVNAALRREGYRVQKRFATIEPDHALQVVHMDFSRSKYFQIFTYDAAAEDYILKVDGRQLHYKEQGKALRSWMVSVIDGHSRLCRMKMYPATGEDATLALLALREFWMPAEGEPHPMQHPARCLWLDRGAAGKTEFFRNALDSVGIDLQLTQSKEAQGKVERQFRTLWSRFELPLALRLGHGATITMQEYNDRLAHFLVQQAEWDHPTQRGTRRQVYNVSLRQHLPDGSLPAREINVDLFSLAFDAQVRVVDGYGCISIDRVRYRVPEKVGRSYVEPGMRLRCYRYPHTGEVVANLVDEPHEQPFFCEPHEQPAFGTFQGQTMTPRERAAARLDLRQPAHERVGTERPAERPAQPTSGGLRTLPVRTEPAEVSGPKAEATATAEATVLSAHEARVYVGKRLAPYGFTYAHRDVQATFDPLIDDGATRADLDELLDQVLRRVA